MPGRVLGLCVPQWFGAGQLEQDAQDAVVRGSGLGLWSSPNLVLSGDPWPYTGWSMGIALLSSLIFCNAHEQWSMTIVDIVDTWSIFASLFNHEQQAERNDDS